MLGPCPSVPFNSEAGKEVFYATDEMDKDTILAKQNNRKFEMGRFKGPGEMNPKTRTLMKVQVLDHKATDDTFRAGLWTRTPRPGLRSSRSGRSMRSWISDRARMIG